MASRAVSDERPTARLNLLDELYLHLDREEEPWSVHLEVRVEGRIEAERLTAAVRDAASRHPIARARLRDARISARSYHWEFADELTDLPLEEVDCNDEAAVTSAREEALSR